MFGRLAHIKFTWQSLLEALGSNSISTYISSDNASDEECEAAKRLNPVAFDNTPKSYDGRWDALHKRPDVNVSNMYKHLTNKKRVFELLVESGKEFDLYVCCRADLYFYKPFPFVIDNALHVPHLNDYDGLNDQCAWGGKIAIERYATLIDRVVELNASFMHDPMLHPFLRDKMFNPEVLARKNMERFNVQRDDQNYTLGPRPLMIEVGAFDGREFTVETSKRYGCEHAGQKH